MAGPFEKHAQVFRGMAIQQFIFDKVCHVALTEAFKSTGKSTGKRPYSHLLCPGLRLASNR